MSLRRLVACLTACIGIALSSPAAQAQVFGTGPWTGLYIGAHGGYGWTDDTNPNVTGWSGGLHAGYNLQLGSALIGVEADYSWGNLNGSSTITGLPLTGTVDSMWSVRGRLGWTIANNFLLYGTAGYGGFDVSVRTLINGVNFAGSADFKGFVAGGGAELLLTRSIVLRLEGLHYMGDGNGTASGSDGDVTIIRAGISYKF